MSMLVFKPTTRRIALVTTATLFFLIFGLPLLLLLLAAFTRQWNGVLPSSLTLHHARALAAGDQGAALLHSVATGVAASFIALLFGGGGALVVRGCPPSLRRGLDMLYFLPVALPSSTIGLAMLIAFSRKPFLLNGTVLLVILAHVVLVMAYAYATISAGLERLPHSLEEIAGSLGASPPRVLLTITLPLLLPQILAALSLGFALSMGELGASIMLYPPQWVTAPVEVFALTDRGDI